MEVPFKHRYLIGRVVVTSNAVASFQSIRFEWKRAKTDDGWRFETTDRFVFLLQNLIFRPDASVDVLCAVTYGTKSSRGTAMEPSKMPTKSLTLSRCLCVGVFFLSIDSSQIAIVRSTFDWQSVRKSSRV